LNEETAMLTLYSYPPLFGVADNNGYGLKVFAYLRLAQLPFRHVHVFDASGAPRAQLPYLDDDGARIGDSDTIIAHVAARHGAALDAALDGHQRRLNLMVNRLLDDLYWVMSYSRWKDERYWPAFRDAFLHAHPQLSESGLLEARAYNAKRYHFQGIGRYEPDEVYARGLADLDALAALMPAAGFVYGPASTSIDAAIYGFIANIWFYDIDTPLKRFVDAHEALRRHCARVHAAIGRGVQA
jgi:glutathione S-transferase